LPRGEERRPIGRPRVIDRAKILAAANEIGLERLTMRAVAEHLGVTTQALYNHVGGRRELVALMANDYGESTPMPSDEITDWREWLAVFATDLRSLLLARPGMAESLMSQGPTTPQALRFVDRAIALMSADGFDEREAIVAYRMIVEFVIAAVQRQEKNEAATSSGGHPNALFYEALAKSDPDELPYLAHIAVGWDRQSPDETFEHTLSCLLQGIDAQRSPVALDRREHRAG
jgi:AcrR family transcriptional regulator